MTSTSAKEFLENYIQGPTTKFVMLAKSGSSRINYFAETDHAKFIVTYNENLSENESFFYFSEVFDELDIPSPTILKISNDRTLYIQEFLGEHTLSEIIAKEGLTERVKSLIKKTLEQLANAQEKTQGIIDYGKTFEYERYDELPITNDLFYFKSFIADTLEIPYHKSSLLLEFKKLTKKIENLKPVGLMIRDFQSRNIMVNHQDDIFFIDYQSAMRGPLMYDVVSFLYQAKANFPESFKQEMLEYYFSHFSNKSEVLELQKSLPFLQLIRFLQVLGAYGFRGLIQRKAHFVTSIDQGIRNIVEFARTWSEIDDYPELKKIILNLQSPLTQQKITAMIESAADTN